MEPAIQQSDNQNLKSCVVYYRVSRSHQKDIRQESDCIDHCQNNGYQIVETFREKISGRKRAREAMTKCLNYLKDNDIHYLVCSELSRLGRTLEVSTILDELTQKQICIIALKEEIKTLNDDFTKDDKQISFALFAISNSIKESDYISYRVKSGRNERIINNGSWSGGKYLPYGYTSIDKKLVIEPLEAERVKMIFQKYLSAWGAVKISNWLNMEGIPTKLGLKWDRATINQMLSHTIYIGQRQWRGEKLDTPDLRIIEDDIYYAVQKRRKERKNPDQTFNKLKKYTYLFDRGVIVCGVCGRKFSGLGGLNKYSCDSGKYTKCCGCESVKMDWLEENIQVYLLHNWSDLIKDNTEIEKQGERLEIDLKLLQQEQINESRKQDRYSEMYAEDRLTRIQYDEKYNACQEKLSKIVDDIVQVRERIQEIKTAKEISKTIKFKILNKYMPHPDSVEFNKEAIINEMNKPDFKGFAFNPINKETLHKVIKRITVNKRTKEGQSINVILVNGKEFQLTFKPKRMTILK